jgi:hypothetical protein
MFADYCLTAVSEAPALMASSLYKMKFRNSLLENKANFAGYFEKL